MAADLPLVIDHWRYFAGVIRAEEGSVAEISNSEYSYRIRTIGCRWSDYSLELSTTNGYMETSSSIGSRKLCSIETS